MNSNNKIEYNGRNYTRVSSLSSNLINWSKIPAHILSRKADIGTQTHQAIDDVLSGIPPTCRPESLPYLDSWQRWYDTVQPTYIAREQRYYDHELLLTGQIDGLVTIGQDILPMLIDYKTSAQEHADSWTRQVCLYRHLLAVNGIECQVKSLVVRLSKSGDYPKVHTYHLSDSITSLALSALAIVT